MALINNRTVLSDQSGGGTTPSPSTGLDIGGIINSGIGALSDVYGNYINAQMQAAGMANAASAAAQQRQFEMNMGLMSQQIAANTATMREAMNYNAQSAKEANALQYQMQKEAMTYNSEEASKQRDWMENMSATAYQRAVNDMRKAGINPILAATNGGANVGSGAAANISSAKSAQAQGVNPANMGLTGVGNYTGQGYHLSDTFATFGAILGTVGNVLSALQSSSLGKGVQNYLNNGLESFTNKIGNAVKDTTEKYSNWVDSRPWKNNWYERMVTRQWSDIKNTFGKQNYSGGGGSHYF